MDKTLCILVVLILAALVDHQVDAEFFFQHVLPKAEDLKDVDLKCVPGRTVIQIIDKPPEPDPEDSGDDDDEVAGDMMRTHMNTGVKEEYCKVCVCSVDGKDEYCSERPAMNVNECLLMTKIMEDFKTAGPFDHTRTLAYRIRRVGGDQPKYQNTDQCIPYVSEYSDCTQENRCSGCSKCLCVGDNTWSCQPATDACDGDEPVLDETSLDEALFSIQNQMRNERKERPSSSPKRYAPEPTEERDLLLEFGIEERKDVDEGLRSLLRNRRSAADQNHTDKGVKFHHTTDEINEDTLKNDNMSGTLQAHKVETIATPHTEFRRTGVLPTQNSPMSLHIEYNQPKVYDHHLTDNKIDATVHSDDKYDAISHEKIMNILGNHTQKQKDKDLSKLVVNELKSGKEVIGDKSAPIMSNVTFMPENDTLTAMAFIAGNLLNKLWNMEKDSGEDSRETDDMKHSKIADLLDLFKEPLNLRQESFLKNALEQLSEAVDKDKTLKNISLCDTLAIENVLKQNNSNVEEEKNKKHTKCNKHNKQAFNATREPQKVNTETISKINNVLSLIKKFDNIQKSLNNLKKFTDENNETNTKKPLRSSHSEDQVLTQEESESLNVFGNILDKVTKLLMPPKKSRKISKSIKNQNIYKDSKDITKTLKDMFNIDIGNNTLSVKDKIIFDYLNTVKRNPKCLLHDLNEDKATSLSRVEGDILLNLSEFFKVKSFVDLVNLVEPKSKSNVRTKQVSTSQQPETFTETTTTIIEGTTQKSVDKLAKTKEKLKKHLKSIIDDLIEIQNAKGQTPNNISIVDALPCIFKMLNSDDAKEKQLNGKEKHLSKIDKVAAIFESLKRDLQSAQNRRSYVEEGIRPKSAIVWERIVKNFDGKIKRNRRLMNGGEPKTYDELKKQIDQIDSSSKTYKNQIAINGVYPSERLALLKTLLEEVRKNINLLDDINVSLPNLKDISTEKKMDLKDFVDNIATNINLNKRVAKNVNKVRTNVRSEQMREGRKETRIKDNYIRTHTMKTDVTSTSDGNNIKLSRDAIINQLIRNRMQLYLKIKEAKGTDPSTDVNYDIAKRILVYLDSGNYNLARELYKILISQKQKATDAPLSRFQEEKKKPSILYKEPIVQFVEPKSRVQWMSQDAWIKQLMNLKNLRS